MSVAISISRIPQEVAELRSTLRSLQQKVDDCQSHLAAIPSPRHRAYQASVQDQGGHVQHIQSGRSDVGSTISSQRQVLAGSSSRESLWASSAGINSLQELSQQLEAECRSRCARDAELQARLGREMGDLSVRLEEHRIITAGEVAEATQTLKALQSTLEDRVEREREERSSEIGELRTTFDSSLRKAAKRSPRIGSLSREGGEQAQEAGRGSEGSEPMEKVVKEIVNYAVHLRQLIAEEREQRLCDQEQLASLTKQTYALQALIQGSTQQGRHS